MAAAQFRDQVRGVDITKRFGAPKRATMKEWFRAARKVIPEIPNPRTDPWVISFEHAEVKWIKFELTNHEGYRVHLVIDRTAPSM